MASTSGLMAGRCTGTTQALKWNTWWAERSTGSRFVRPGSAAPGDLDGDVSGFDGGDREYSCGKVRIPGVARCIVDTK